MAQQIQWRRGSAAAWTAADPIMAEGEAGYEIDTNKFKIGDGVQAWSSLPYFGDGGGTAADITFDNAESGLDATNVQDAIDEVVAESITEHAELPDLASSGHPADVIIPDTTDFDGNLSSADDTTQKALDTLDNLKLDTIGAPTDVTTNNATTSAHGLLPKLSGSASDALKGDGSWGSGGSSLYATTVTIAAGDWSSGSATKTLTGMTSTATVWVSPNAASYAVFVNSVVRCTGQATNSITFTCDSTPASSITVNVAYMEPTT